MTLRGTAERPAGAPSRVGGGLDPGGVLDEATGLDFRRCGPLLSARAPRTSCHDDNDWDVSSGGERSSRRRPSHRRLLEGRSRSRQPSRPGLTTRPIRRKQTAALSHACQQARRTIQAAQERHVGDRQSPRERSSYRQSTATSSAWQISRIRIPLSAPIRSTSTAVDTDSIESRLTAQRRPIGSSSGSSTTSLGRPLIVVVHGATSARRSRGMAASRDRTRTGRRPISGGSHHHSSPWTGTTLTWPKPRVGTKRDRPSHLRRQSGELRTQLRRRHRFRRTGSDREGLSVPHRRVRHRWFRRGAGERRRGGCGQRSY